MWQMVLKRWRRGNNHQLTELYSFSLLFTLAQSFMLIFEPIFFYQQGISLAWIALYYAVHYSLYTAVLPLGGKFAARFGLERSLVLSTPLFILYALALAGMAWQPQLFWAALLLLTIHKIFYWPAYHADFAAFGSQEKFGKQLSWMTLVVYGVGVVGPLTGGLVATFWGFPVLFLIAAATVLMASWQLLGTSDEYHGTHLGYQEVWEAVISQRYRGMVVAILGMGEDLVNLQFWPILMFIVLGSAAAVGVVNSFTTLVMIMAGFLIGALIDRYSRQKILRLFLPLLSVTHVLRGLTAAPWQAVTYDLAAKLAFIGARTPFLARLYSQGRSGDVLTYMVAFEAVLAFAKALTAWVLVGVFWYFAAQPAFLIAFVLAAMLSWLYWFL